MSEESGGSNQLVGGYATQQFRFESFRSITPQYQAQQAKEEPIFAKKSEAENWCTSHRIVSVRKISRLEGCRPEKNMVCRDRQTKVGWEVLGGQSFECAMRTN
jgi:hypothetical protein